MVKTTTLSEKVVLARSRANDLNGVKTLNCWGAGIKDVSVLKRIPNVEVINFSANCIDCLEAFTSCHNLKELYLRKNCIKNIDDLTCLRNLSNLRLLWLSGNPFCEGVDEETYRLSVLRILPNLLKLDSTTVTIEELERAKDFDEAANQDQDKKDAATSSPPLASGEADLAAKDTPSSTARDPSHRVSPPPPAALSGANEISPDSFPPAADRVQREEVHTDVQRTQSPTTHDPAEPSVPGDESSPGVERSPESITQERLKSDRKEEEQSNDAGSSSDAAVESSLTSETLNIVETSANEFPRESLSTTDIKSTSGNLESNPDPKPLKSDNVSDPKPPNAYDPIPSEAATCSGQDSNSSRVPSPPAVSSNSSTHSSSGTNPGESMVDVSLEETNQLRVQLGLKPLTVAKYATSNRTPPKPRKPRKRAKCSPGTNNNLLTATLALIEELDEESLFIAREAISERLADREDDQWERGDEHTSSSHDETEVTRVEIVKPKESFREKIVEMLEPG